MSPAAYPRPTGEIETKVIDGLWVELSEILVQAWADRFADVRGFELGCSKTLGTNSKLLVDVFTGDGGYAARDALERREKDYENNSDASEQDRAHAQKLADDIRDTKIKMAQVANTVKTRVDAIRFRGKLQNKPANVIQAEVNDQIAQGRRACKELADQLRDTAKTITSNSGSDSDDDSDTASRRGGGVATASEQHEAKSRVLGEAPKAAEDAPVHRDGAPATPESAGEEQHREQPPAPSAQPAQAQQVGQSGAGPAGHDTAKGASASAHGPAAQAATHAASSAAVHERPVHQSAPAPQFAQSPAGEVRAGFFAQAPQSARPTDPKQTSTGAQAGTQASAPASQPAHERQAQEDRSDEHHHAGAQLDSSATTSAMGGAAVAPLAPSAGLDHTPWSATDPNRIAPSGHFLGAGDTGGAGIRDGYLIAGVDPDQELVDETCERASSFAAALGAARSMWNLLPPTGLVVVGLKDTDGAASFRAFTGEGLSWVHPGAPLPAGMALGLNIGPNLAPLATAAHAHIAATALDWLQWARVGQPGSGAALVCLASTVAVPEDLGWAIRRLNEHIEVEDLRREAVVREVSASGSPTSGTHRLTATDADIAGELARLAPNVLAPVGIELAVACVEDTAAPRLCPALQEAVNVFRQGYMPSPELLGRLRAGAMDAHYSMEVLRGSVEAMPLEDQAMEMWEYLDEQAALSACVSTMLAVNLPRAQSEPMARQMLADIGYEYATVTGGNFAAVKGRIAKALDTGRWAPPR